MDSKKIISNKIFNYQKLLIGFILLSEVLNRPINGSYINNPDSSLKIPQFLNAYPLNKTVIRGSQVVFQCHVFSEKRPTIKWLRRLSKFKSSSFENMYSTIYYNGQAYELLTSGHEKQQISRNLYLSKLLINDVQEQDEGIYACVAIGRWGHNVREANLKVYVPDNDIDYNEYWSDYSVEDEVFSSHSTKLWLLFLMPVGLALLPLFVWLCYVNHRSYQNYSLTNEC